MALSVNNTEQFAQRKHVDPGPREDPSLLHLFEMAVKPPGQGQVGSLTNRVTLNALNSVKNVKLVKKHELSMAGPISTVGVEKTYRNSKAFEKILSVLEDPNKHGKIPLRFLGLAHQEREEYPLYKFKIREGLDEDYKKVFESINKIVDGRGIFLGREEGVDEFNGKFYEDVIEARDHGHAIDPEENQKKNRERLAEKLLLDTVLGQKIQNPLFQSVDSRIKDLPPDVQEAFTQFKKEHLESEEITAENKIIQTELSDEFYIYKILEGYSPEEAKQYTIFYREAMDLSDMKPRFRRNPEKSGNKAYANAYADMRFMLEGLTKSSNLQFSKNEAKEAAHTHALNFCVERLDFMGVGSDVLQLNEYQAFLEVNNLTNDDTSLAIWKHGEALKESFEIFGPEGSHAYAMARAAYGQSPGNSLWEMANSKLYSTAYAVKLFELSNSEGSNPEKSPIEEAKALASRIQSGIQDSKVSGSPKLETENEIFETENEIFMKAKACAFALNARSTDESPPSTDESSPEASSSEASSREDRETVKKRQRELRKTVYDKILKDLNGKDPSFQKYYYEALESGKDREVALTFADEIQGLVKSGSSESEIDDEIFSFASAKYTTEIKSEHFSSFVQEIKTELKDMGTFFKYDYKDALKSGLDTGSALKLAAEKSTDRTAKAKITLKGILTDLKEGLKDKSSSIEQFVRPAASLFSRDFSVSKEKSRLLSEFGKKIEELSNELEAETESESVGQQEIKLQEIHDKCRAALIKLRADLRKPRYEIQNSSVSKHASKVVRDGQTYLERQLHEFRAGRTDARVNAAVRKYLPGIPLPPEHPPLRFVLTPNSRKG